MDFYVETTLRDLIISSLNNIQVETLPTKIRLPIQITIQKGLLCRIDFKI